MLENTRAYIALISLDVTDAVNCRQMSLHVRPVGELFTANLTLMLALSTLTVRRVVVSADRRLVAEHHVTQLTLDTRGPQLKHRKCVDTTLLEMAREKRL